MREFYDDNVLLESETAKELYSKVKDLPIIDYHCHLNDNQIAENSKITNIGEFWLACDHYKWRTMRLCGVDEKYITGNASYKEKFLAFAEIMPKLIGNPVYYWAQFELKNIFGINEPLNKETAEEIYQKANERLKDLTIRELLKKFNVEFIATTDDPYSNLENHKSYENLLVTPTFRADRCFNEKIDKKELEKRFDYFLSKGCKISDYGFDNVGEDTSDIEWLMEACYDRNIVLQLHFGTLRNINSKALENIGKDSGFDVFRGTVDTDKIAYVLDKMNSKNKLPKIILYSLNENAVKSLCTISGAFKNVYIGSAWWFNDTVLGIKQQLKSISEYAVLGTNMGMLTDSRSFGSYVRFDFFRRILCSYVGDLIEKGEYDKASGEDLVKDISYRNIKALLKI